MTREEHVFAWLNRKYTQRADERQKAMGLQYTTAETHDLAREIVNYIDHGGGLVGDLPRQVDREPKIHFLQNRQRTKCNVPLEWIGNFAYDRNYLNGNAYRITSDWDMVTCRRCLHLRHADAAPK